MTLDVFDIWQKLMSLCNVQQGGQIRPQTDFQNWYNAVNTMLFHAKCSKFQLGQQVTDELSPFLTTKAVLVTAGYVVLPADYAYLADVRIIRQKDENVCNSLQQLPIIDGTGKSRKFVDPDYAKMVQAYAGMNLVEKTVNVIDNQQWGDCLNHARKGPTWNNPKATQNEGGFKIAPVGIQAVVLDYFHTPRNAIFAYTVGSGDIVQYNSAGSTQLEWTSVIENEFLAELQKKYAAAVGDMGLYQQADNDKKMLA